MQPRNEALQIPEGNGRFFVIRLDEPHGAFHFRFPSFNRAARLLDLLRPLADRGDGAERSVRDLAELFDAAGYAIGLCWSHRGLELEAGTVPRLRDTSSDAWRDYGEAVIDELQDHGLTFPEILRLVTEMISELGDRVSEFAEADELAGN